MKETGSPITAQLGAAPGDLMKVLTVIGTIFLPLTFIVGVYGMNLAIPELRWPWAYPAVWGVMVAIAAGLLVVFRRKRWL